MVKFVSQSNIGTVSGNAGETFETGDRAHLGFPEHIDTILDWTVGGVFLASDYIPYTFIHASTCSWESHGGCSSCSLVVGMVLAPCLLYTHTHIHMCTHTHLKYFSVSQTHTAHPMYGIHTIRPVTTLLLTTHGRHRYQSQVLFQLRIWILPIKNMVHCFCGYHWACLISVVNSLSRRQCTPRLCPFGTLGHYQGWEVNKILRRAADSTTATTS